MLKRHTLLLFLFAGIFATLFTRAQTTSFITYGVEQGLVQSQVQTLVQDNDGNLWIGTLAGLSRFNGLTFQNFSKKDGLAEDWVTVSYKDSKGDIIPKRKNSKASISRNTRVSAPSRPL